MHKHIVLHHFILFLFI